MLGLLLVFGLSKISEASSVDPGFKRRIENIVSDIRENSVDNVCKNLEAIESLLPNQVTSVRVFDYGGVIRCDTKPLLIGSDMSRFQDMDGVIIAGWTVKPLNQFESPIMWHPLATSYFSVSLL